MLAPLHNSGPQQNPWARSKVTNQLTANQGGWPGCQALLPTWQSHSLPLYGEDTHPGSLSKHIPEITAWGPGPRALSGGSSSTPQTPVKHRAGPHLANQEPHGALSFPGAQDPTTLEVTPWLRSSLGNKFLEQVPHEGDFQPRDVTLPATDLEEGVTPSSRRAAPLTQSP